MTDTTPDTAIDARLSELIGRIEHCLGEIRGVLDPNSQAWAIGHCNQIKHDLGEIKALVCSPSYQSRYRELSEKPGDENDRTKEPKGYE